MAELAHIVMLTGKLTGFLILVLSVCEVEASNLHFTCSDYIISVKSLLILEV